MTGAVDVGAWLEALSLSKYVEIFVENDVDLDVLPDLEEADLAELGVSLGHRKKILRAVAEQIDDFVQVVQSAPLSTVATAPAAGPELRQLTVMFVDLVGSTALSRRLDPEDLREILRSYQNAVSGETTRFDGYIAHFMGDGILAYFGWPKAYEDQADRAMHAALGIVEAVQGLKLSNETRLELRIGIASGQVVVGDLIGEGGSETAAVTGETPNLAARLQAFAQPGQIVISDSTKRLVGNAFELLGQGTQLFKGFSEPIPVWRLLGKTGVASRYESVHGTTILPLVGRKPEIGLLLDRWEMAKSGSGQAVFVSGEAGIGKSRLIQALRELIADEPHFRVRLQASPYHTASALYPLARQLEQAARISTGDSASEKRQKLEQLLSVSTDDFLSHLQILAPLLSVPLGEDDILQTLTADQLRERTIETFVEQLIGLSRRKPALFLFEDAHWMDPSTEESVTLMTQRLADEAVLAVITHRPEWQPEWATGYDHVAQLALPRLSAAHAAEMVRHAAGENADHNLIARIAERTDGVPLYIEELTRSIYEAGNDVAIESEEIPETLQGLLLARLDRLEPEVRELAQVGAVIGREFTSDLLGEALDRTEGLDAALDQLTASRLIHPRGSPQSRYYVFHHALIQEAAYSSLLARRRQTYHHRIAQALERQSDGGADITPELIAQHFTAADIADPAILWWLRAGKRAHERSAFFEAVQHFQRGLELADNLPDGPERLERQLELELGLGNTQITTGDLDDALRGFNQAARLARLTDSPLNLARAAIGFEHAEFILGVAEDASITLLEEAIEKLDDSDTVERCRMLGALARAYATVGEREKAESVGEMAVSLARRIGDKRGLFDALTNRFLTTPTHRNDELYKAVQDLHALATDLGEYEMIMRSESWRMYQYIQAGDRERFAASLITHRQLAIKHQTPIHTYVSTCGLALEAILDGAFSDAEARAEEAFAEGSRLNMASADGVYGTQMFTIRREQGRLAEVAPVFKKFVDENPNQAAWRPGLALIASDLGFLEPAQKAFDQIAEEGFVFPFDAKRSMTLSYLAEVCARLEDRARAETLYDILRPYENTTITMGLTTVCYGAATRFLGLLCTTLEDWNRAAGYFESAIEMNEALQAGPWLAHSQADYAAMLCRRGDTRYRAKTEHLIESAAEAATKYDMTMLRNRVAALR